MPIQGKKKLPKQQKNKKASILQSKRFLTAPQVSGLICKTEGWLGRKRREGGGPAFRYIGKAPIYDEQDVLHWIKKIPKITRIRKLYRN